MLRFPIQLLTLVATVGHSSTSGTFFQNGVREPAAETEMAADGEEGRKKDFSVFLGHEGFSPHDI